MAELEFAGTTFRGGKMFAVITALTTLGGGAYGGFEVYKDYMDMKEIIQNIDIGAIETANALQIQKLDDAIKYTVDIRDNLAEDVNTLEERNARDFAALKLSVSDDVARLEKLVDTLEADVMAAESNMRFLRKSILDKMDEFEERMRTTLANNQEVIATVRDNISGQLTLSEERIKTTQDSIDATLDGIRDEMNSNTKAVTESIREVEATIRSSEKDVRSTMRETETRLIADMDTLEKEIKETLQEALDNPLNN